jgi:hypothetical protein
MRRLGWIAAVVAICVLTLSGAAANGQGVPPTTGATYFEFHFDLEDEAARRVEAGDPRATGDLTLSSGEASVLDVVSLFALNARITNDGGEWVGTGRAFYGGEEYQADLFELQGEGSYEGLTLFLFEWAQPSSWA